MLKKENKIFKNLYNDLGWDIENSIKRDDWKDTKEIISKGKNWIIDEIKKSEAPKNYSSIKKQLEGQKNSRPSNSAFSALKEKSSIEDNRAKFY